MGASAASVQRACLNPNQGSVYGAAAVERSPQWLLSGGRRLAAATRNVVRHCGYSHCAGQSHCAMPPFPYLKSIAASPSIMLLADRRSLAPPADRRRAWRLVRRLEQLGYTVTIEP